MARGGGTGQQHPPTHTHTLKQAEFANVNTIFSPYTIRFSSSEWKYSLHKSVGFVRHLSLGM